MAGLEQRPRPMPNAFNFAASPFDCLSPRRARRCGARWRGHRYHFPEVQRAVLDAGSAPTHLFVIIKGHVVQTEGDEVLASYGPDDSFDGRALVAGRTGSRFTVAEELIAYQLARETVGELIARNTAFGALLFSDLGHKLGTLAQRADRHELQSLTLARVDQAYLRAAHVVDAATDIVSVVRLFHAERTTSVLVSGLPQGGLGIFTGTTLQRAILDGRPLERLAVGEFASQPVFTVRADDQLGDALVVLLRARVHRLAVLDAQGQVLGILEAPGPARLRGNHIPDPITVQIEQAADLQALSDERLARSRAWWPRLLPGRRAVALMARLVAAPRAPVRARLRQMLAHAGRGSGPRHALFVKLGSEGARREQLLKTDQDINGSAAARRLHARRPRTSTPSAPLVGCAAHVPRVARAASCSATRSGAALWWPADLAGSRAADGLDPARPREGPGALAIFLDAHACERGAALAAATVRRET